MKRRRIVRDYFEAAIVAVMLALFVRTFLFEAFKIPTPSMERSLMVGDHIIVDKFGLAQRLPFESGLLPLRPIERGEVVVFKFEREPEKDYVKRVVGLPGDVVRVEGKALFVNNKEMQESYTQHIDPETIPERDFLPAVTVPPDHYFVMGDNRDNSADSREWGFVPRARIRGRALFIYWSLAPPDPADGADAAGAAAATGASGVMSKTRWERTFRPIH